MAADQTAPKIVAVKRLVGEAAERDAEQAQAAYEQAREGFNETANPEPTWKLPPDEWPGLIAPRDT